MLELSVRDVLFFFNNVLYSQINGVGMGNPLGPTLANAFLCHHEIKWLDNCPSDFKPIFYRRYVDDTFILFRDPSHVAKFLDYLNSQHSCIKFTFDIEDNNQLNFLDVKKKSLKLRIHFKLLFFVNLLSFVLVSNLIPLSLTIFELI